MVVNRPIPRQFCGTRDQPGSSARLAYSCFIYIWTMTVPLPRLGICSFTDILWFSSTKSCSTKYSDTTEGRFLPNPPVVTHNREKLTFPRESSNVADDNVFEVPRNVLSHFQQHDPVTALQMILRLCQVQKHDTTVRQFFDEGRTVVAVEGLHMRRDETAVMAWRMNDFAQQWSELGW